MRKRMKQLAGGKFEYAKPQLLLSEEEITFTVCEGETYEGAFTIEALPSMKIRGLVYVTNSRMEVINSQFEGDKVRIRYQFHTNGLCEGLVEKGEFIIVCNQNEISLSFCASISKKYVETSIGYIENLYDFSCLAKENWSEAFQLFYHKSFSNIIKSGEIKERMIYQGMIGTKPSNQSIEEFLIGIRKKDKIHFRTDEKEFSIYGIKETSKKSFEIKKDNWGYIEIIASADAEFIQIPKTVISSEDFLGSTYTFEFFIQPQYMHPGKNIGRIQLSGRYETIDVQIMASASENKKQPESRQKKQYLADLMKLYMDYRFKRMVTGEWANKTIDILTELQVLEPKEAMYPLMKAQCLIINRQKQEAEWILQKFKREWQNKNSPIWGYYLYIMTLIEREVLYVDRMTQEIESIFHENPDSVMLFWILTFLRESYIGNNALKLKDIACRMMKKTSSPYLYIEAFYLVWQDPYLLTKLDEFEMHLLRWAIRHQVLSKDITMQIFQIMETKKQFHPVLYEIMAAAYEFDPKPDYLEILCGYLIKGQQYDKKYHKWYALGIESELRITNLYEAYLLSMDERSIAPVPKIIQMYFQYECNLPYKKMAVLYNNIIAAKMTNLEVYQNYCRIMARFTMNQILAGHMDDNLAVIYEDMLEPAVINEDMAKALSRILFTQKLSVFDNSMTKVIVYQRQMKDPQIVSIADKTAYITLYTEEYVLIFEDEKGCRYSGGVGYHLEKLMDSKKYLHRCMELAPLELPYLISYFDKRQNYSDFEEEDAQYFPTIMFSPAVSSMYKAHLLPEILRFYQVHENAEKITEYLEKANYKKLDDLSRMFALESAVDNQLFDFAYEKLQEYGIDQIAAAARAALASDRIEKTHCEEDEFLTNMAISAFRSKKFNDKTLHYLCQYYNGSTEELLDIWFAAKEMDIDLFEISERILVQMLYTNHMVQDGMPIFKYFYEAGGKDMIILAYISTLAHYYFTEKQNVESDIFELIEARYLYHLELNDACKLALLRYYAELPNISKKQLGIADEILGEYISKNMYFSFYRQLAPELILKYHLYDKVFLEYHTAPCSRVVLSYRRDEDGDAFLKEEMQEVYAGIFVKTFILFFGEAVWYYISEEHDGQADITERSRMISNTIYNESDKSRYNLLNQMLVSNTLQEDSQLQMTMKQYAALDEVTKHVFQLL